MKRILSLSILITLSVAIYAQEAEVTDTIVRKDTVVVPVKDTTHHHHGSGVGFAISGNFGGGLAAANAGTPDANHLSYNNMSNVSFPNANYSSSGGLNVGFDLDLLFGKQRNLELSAGLTYIYSKGTADFSGYHAEYEATDGNGNSYRRLVTATTATESLKYRNVSVPILFKYSTNPDKKLGAFIQIGPILSVSGSASGTMNATMDYEAVYHYNAATNTFGYSPNTSPGDWVITRQALASELGSGQSVSNYFNQLNARGYNVALDKTASGSAAKVTYHLGGGMMVRAGGEYRASKMVHVLFGITALFTSNSRSVGSFSPITASNDLSTISASNFLNGTSSLLTMQVGVNLGLQIRLVK